MPQSQSFLIKAAPLVFVFLWSTGWISARAAIIDSDPLTFLAARFACALVVFGILVVAVRATFPTRGIDYVHAFVSGILLHALYLGGVWFAVGQGVPAGVSGVVAATQPILTAMLAPFLISERISARQWAGILVGFAGIMFVLAPRIAAVPVDQIDTWKVALAVNLGGMLAVTFGTFYQKWYLPKGDLRAMAFLQYVGALPVALLGAYLFEPQMKFTISLTSVATMAWSVLAISLGAILLLLWLIRQGAVSRAATLIYLVPPSTALEAWLLFGETLTLIQIFGIALTVAGVALAVTKRG